MNCGNDWRMRLDASDILAVVPLEGVLSTCVVVTVVAALATNRVAIETGMLSGLLAQVLIVAVDPGSARPGLAHPAVVAIGVLFVVTAVSFESGAPTAFANLSLGHPRSMHGAQLRLIVPVTLLSALINNTPVVAMYLPIVRDWARRIRVSPSKLLMPLSFSSILGGQRTLVGSASNRLPGRFLFEIERGVLVIPATSPDTRPRVRDRQGFAGALVYGPVGYRSMDFPRAGLPLAVLLAVLCVVLCPWIFPFRPL